MQQAAARTTRRIVVTDVLQDPSLNPDDNLLRFASAGFENLTIWWTLTPGTIQRMLRHLGFDRQTTTFSSYKHYLGHDMSRDPIDIPMFTVVAERAIDPSIGARSVEPASFRWPGARSIGRPGARCSPG